jgi:hypothetical protein
MVRLDRTARPSPRASPYVAWRSRGQRPINPVRLTQPSVPAEVSSQTGPGSAPLVRRVAAWLSWFAGLFVLWLLLVGTVQDVELFGGLGAAAIGAAAVEVVRGQGLLRFRVQWRWLRRGWRPLVRVMPEFLLVMAAIFRRSQGTFRELDFPTGGERAVDAGRRAFVVLASSLSPNRLVVDLDPETGEALVHDLVPGASSSELP